MNNTLTGYVVLAAVAGFVVGMLLMWLLMRGNRKEKEQHQALVQKFGEYRDEVDKHFADTAAAVDELNRSYQKVVAHLSKGAQELMSREALQEQLAKRVDKSITVAYLAKEAGTQGGNGADDLPPPPPYTDATEAEVVPTNGQPDRVPDRIGPHAEAAAEAEKQQATQPKHPDLPQPEPIDLQQPKG